MAIAACVPWLRTSDLASEAVRADLADLVRSRRPILGECSTGTRLHFQSPLPTEEALGLIPLVDDDLGLPRSEP